MIFANKIKHLLLGTLIPLFAASTLVLTGFSLWQFDINIEKNIDFHSQSVVVNPYVDGDYGIITTAQNNVLYPNNWRLAFEEGVEEDIYDNTTGINFTPDIDVNIKITMDDYAIETFRLEIKTEIISDNCSVNLNDYIYPSGFMVGGVNARFPHYYELSSAEETLAANYTESSGGLDLMITPIFYWVSGMKPNNTASYGEFLGVMRECTCTVKVTMTLTILGFNSTDFSTTTNTGETL